MIGDSLLQLVLGLAALLGVGTGFVGMFVLRVEHNSERRRSDQHEALTRAIEARVRELERGRP